MSGEKPPNCQCCFCGRSISPESPDPGELVFVTDFGREESGRQSQSLFCHARCLRERLHSSARLYAADLGGERDV